MFLAHSFSENQKVALTSAKRQQNPNSSFNAKMLEKGWKIDSVGPTNQFFKEN